MNDRVISPASGFARDISAAARRARLLQPWAAGGGDNGAHQVALLPRGIPRGEQGSLGLLDGLPLKWVGSFAIATEPWIRLATSIWESVSSSFEILLVGEVSNWPNVNTASPKRVVFFCVLQPPQFGNT